MLFASVSFWGFAQFVLTVAVCAAAAAYVLSPQFRQGLQILFGKQVSKLSTAAEREMAEIAKQEEVILKGSHKASELRGDLQTEGEKLGEAEQAVTTAAQDLKLAKDLASERLKKADSAISNENLNAAVKSDSQVLARAKYLKLQMQLRDTQSGVVTKLEHTVQKTKEAVEAAKEKLADLKLSAVSDAAQEKAASVLNSATSVLESLKGVDGIGSKIAKEHDAVRRQYNQANARFEDAQGSDADRAFEQAKKERDLGSLIDSI